MNLLRSFSEKLRRFGGYRLILNGWLFIRIDEVVAIVLCTATNTFEDCETRSGSCVGIDVDYLTTLNVLEKSHSCVASVVLDHVGVFLALSDIESRMLEDTPLPVRALRGVI